MKAVKGFMTEDGKFYDSDVDARLHEAVKALTMLCESHKPKAIPADRLLTVLSNWSPVIREFLDANEAAKEARVSADQKNTSPVSRYTPNDADGDVDYAAVVEQPPSGPEHLFEVGSGSSLEGVFKRS